MKSRALALLLWAACAELPATEEYSAEANSAAVKVAGDKLVLQTQAGQVQGMLKGNTREFLGIPYAQPPIGPLRFAAPEPVAAWSNIRDATNPENRACKSQASSATWTCPKTA